ncbi:MAG: hypothetical protein LBD24_01795 [Spirochaetaceae bacterium]|nr:hypothetical protein [Spirochaetaceae bacterium]
MHYSEATGGLAGTAGGWAAMFETAGGWAAILKPSETGRGNYRDIFVEIFKISFKCIYHYIYFRKPKEEFPWRKLLWNGCIRPL